MSARRKGGRCRECRASDGGKAPSQILDAVRSARASCVSKILPTFQTQPLYGRLLPAPNVDTRYLRSSRRCVHDPADREDRGRIGIGHPQGKTSMTLRRPLVHAEDSGISSFAVPPQVVRRPCIPTPLGRKSRVHDGRTCARGGRRARLPDCACHTGNRAPIKGGERAPMRFEKSAPASSNGGWRHPSNTCRAFVRVRMVFRKGKKED